MLGTGRSNGFQDGNGLHDNGWKFIHVAQRVNDKRNGVFFPNQLQGVYVKRHHRQHRQQGFQNRGVSGMVPSHVHHRRDRLSDQLWNHRLIDRDSVGVGGVGG